MSMLPSAFNANEHKGMDEREAIPAGKYTAMIVESDKRESKKTPGNYYFRLVFEVTGSEEHGQQYNGRKLFTNLNLINASAQAVEIANKELKTICDAVGKVAIQDTVELHNIPMLVTVRKTEATPQYPEGNEITFYESLGGVASPGNSGSAAAKPPSSESNGGGEQKKRAWE